MALLAAYLAGRLVLPFADGASHAVLRWGLADAVYLAAAVTCGLRALAVERDRLAWTLMALAISSYLAGSVIDPLTVDSAAETTSAAAHAAWLLFYPLAYAALVLLARATLRPFTLAFAVDGLLGALALAAVVVAIGFPSLHGEYATGDLIAGLSYPVGDLLLLAFSAWIATMVGWGASAMWRMLVVAFGVLLLGDIALTVQAAVGGYGEEAVTSALYPAAMALLALAAWRERGRPRSLRPDVAALLTFPAAAVAVALLVLVIGEPLGLLPGAEYLCFAVLVLAFARMVLVSQHIVSLQDGRRFQQGFAEAKIGMAIVDEELRWQRVNPALAAMLGERPGALSGQEVAAWTPPPMRDGLRGSAHARWPRASRSWVGTCACGGATAPRSTSRSTSPRSRARTGLRSSSCRSAT